MPRLPETSSGYNEPHKLFPFWLCLSPASYKRLEWDKPPELPDSEPKVTKDIQLETGEEVDRIMRENKDIER